MLRSFSAMVLRDVRLALRQGSTALMAVAFFLIAVSLFPLGIGPETNLLARVGPGVVWVCALLACLLTLDRLFQADLEDGSLDLIVLGPLPHSLVVLAKCLAHWLTTGLPLVLASPVLGLLMNVPREGIGGIALSLALGTPTLSLVGAIGAALTAGMRRGGVLLSLLVLPLYVPVLIFGVGTAIAFAEDRPATSPALALSALALASAVLAPLASAAALRLSLE